MTPPATLAPGTPTVGAIRAAGGIAVATAADLVRPDDRARLVDEVTRQLGPVDVLVNNAAVTYFAPVVDFSPRHYDLMFDVQVRAPFEITGGGEGAEASGA